MSILELQEYAKENGFDSCEFEFVNFIGKQVKGKWLDAYFGLFRIDGMDEKTFISVNQWRELFGDTVNFHVI